MGATLHCGVWASHCGGLSRCRARALGAEASVVVARRSQSAGSAVVAHQPSCSAACGILPDQGSNPHPLHWQEDSYLLTYLLIYLFIFGCVGSSFLCEGFLQLRRAGATLNRGARASHCCSLSRCGAQAPDAQAQ